MMCMKKCGCRKHSCNRPGWRKEYLGKRLCECKYYRVCCERFIDAPCKNDAWDNDCDNDCDRDCGRDHDCDC